MPALRRDLDVFHLVHRRCAELLDDGDEGECIWIACACRAVPVRVVAFPKSPAPPKVFTVTLDAFLKAA